MKGHSERNNSGKPEENFENLEVNRAILLYSDIYNFQLNEPRALYIPSLGFHMLRSVRNRELRVRI